MSDPVSVPKTYIAGDGLPRVDGPPIPKHIRIAAHEARQGGPLGYGRLGYHVAKEAGILLGDVYDDDDEKVDAAIDELNAGASDEETIAALRRHLRHVMALVPKRRENTFIRSFNAVVEETLISR